MQKLLGVFAKEESMKKRFLTLIRDHHHFRKLREMAHLDLLPEQRVIRQANSYIVESPQNVFIVKLITPDSVERYLRGQEFDTINFFDFIPDEETEMIAKSRVWRRGGKLFFFSVDKQ